MVSSAWWREAGTASDWLAHPHNGSDARNRNQNLSHFEAEMLLTVTIYIRMGTHKDLDDS